MENPDPHFCFKGPYLRIIVFKNPEDSGGSFTQEPALQAERLQTTSGWARREPASERPQG